MESIGERMTESLLWWQIWCKQIYDRRYDTNMIEYVMPINMMPIWRYDANRHDTTVTEDMMPV